MPTEASALLSAPAPQRDPVVIAHRGARLLAVENTLEALRVAFLEGAGGVEFDVQRTVDGELVLFHDDDLHALTGTRGRVPELTWRDVRKLELHDRHGHRGRIPHFDEVLELLDGRAGLFNLELKVVADEAERLTAAVVDALVERPQAGWVLSSFSRRALERLAGSGLSASRALLVDDDPRCDWWAAGMAGPQGAAALAKAGLAVGGHLDAVHPHGALVNAARMQLWQAGGFDVNVWTLNEPEQWRLASASGVSGLITDDPAGLLAWRRQRRDLV